jgi:hypothetical protein
MIRALSRTNSMFCTALPTGCIVVSAWRGFISMSGEVRVWFGINWESKQHSFGHSRPIPEGRKNHAKNYETFAHLNIFRKLVPHPPQPRKLVVARHRGQLGVNVGGHAQTADHRDVLCARPGKKNCLNSGREKSRR